MSNCKILIIDDDTDDIEILTDAFVQSGVDCVQYVHTAMEAFMFLEAIPRVEDLPKLIVTDLYLPGISGPEFLADLKKMEKYRHLPIIVLSGSKSPQEVKRYKDLGAVDYLVKPTTYEDYLAVARSIANRIKLAEN